MEIDLSHASPTMGVIILLGLHLVMKVGEFAWKIFEKKNKNNDHEITQVSLALTQNTQAVRDLRIQMGIIERDIAEFQKHKIDIQRVFSAVKILAGPKWPRVRKAIQEDSLPKHD